MKRAIPKTKRPAVDRLSYILPLGKSLFDDQEELLALIKRRINRAKAEGLCTRAYVRGARYRENIRIPLDGGSSAFVQIGALIPSRQNGGIRVVINPARFKEGDAAQFNKVMRRIIGESYLELMACPLINNIDVAVDILDANLNKILVSCCNAQRCTMFGKRINSRAQIETYNFGSVKSDYMSAVYDKHRERVHAAVLALLKTGARTEGLDSNMVRQVFRAKSARDKVRVEARRKKLRGLPLHEIRNLPNRFERFKFCDLDAEGTDLPPFIRESFLALCRQNGVKAALLNFSHTEWVRKVNAFYRSRQATWWQPDGLWAEACDSLRDLGLFPDQAFVEPWLRKNDDDVDDI